jgi:hypothetical protein
MNIQLLLAPYDSGHSLNQLTGAIRAIRDHVPVAAATVASYSPEDDHDQGVCRAALAAIEALVGRAP